MPATMKTSAEWEREDTLTHELGIAYNEVDRLERELTIHHNYVMALAEQRASIRP